MTTKPNLNTQSYVSCEIDGTEYILEKWSENECRNGITKSQRSTGTEDKNYHVRNDNLLEFAGEESVPLICFDDQIFTFRNEEIDLTQLIALDETEESAVLTKNIDNKSTGDELIDNVDNEPINNAEAMFNKDCLDDNDIAEVVSAFKCKICSYTTQDKNLLIQHFQDVHLNANNLDTYQETEEQILEQEHSSESEEVRLVYMCGQCSDCFPSIDSCKEHMINVHCLVSNSVDRKKDTGSNNAATADNKSITPAMSHKSNFLYCKQNDNFEERFIKCKHRNCPYKFTTTEKLQQHIACHLEMDGTNYFRCSICKDLKFSKWRPCSLHLWKDHQIDVDLYSCTVCKEYKSATLVKLMTHMKVHSENREYQCMECGKCFKQSSQLRNHRVMHLDRKTAEVSRWYTSKKCEICDKIYADSKCLKNHIQAVHSKLKPFVCNVCGHSCARKAMLQMHLRQHTGDKPFSCSSCDYKTGDHNSLRRHIMRHTGDRPYKCPHCSYSAIQSNSYKNHLRSKHPKQSGVFVCESCPFKTVRNETFIQHVELHEKGQIKKSSPQKDKEESHKTDDAVEVFPGNIAATQLIYNCLGAFSKVGKGLKANLMSSSTSADGTSQTITIEIPSKYLEDNLPSSSSSEFNVDPEDDETMHCFLKIPREEDENVDTGGITIPAEPE